MRNNFAKTATTMLCALLFIVIGSCFSAFLYKSEIVKAENPKIVVSSGISVYDEKGDKIISELKLSKMKLGLKPATGEEDAETDIPTTVHEKQGSEGVYAVFNLLAPSGSNIYITNIKIEGEVDEKIIASEKENIKVSIKEIDKSTTSLKEDKVFLGKTEATSNKTKYTFLIWLSSKIDKKFNSATISFDLSFENV